MPRTKAKKTVARKSTVKRKPAVVKTKSTSTAVLAKARKEILTLKRQLKDALKKINDLKKDALKLKVEQKKKIASAKKKQATKRKAAAKKKTVRKKK